MHLKSNQSVFYPLSRYAAGLNAVNTSSLAGANGYRIFITIAVLLGDGAFNVARVSIITVKDYIKRRK